MYLSQDYQQLIYQLVKIFQILSKEGDSGLWVDEIGRYMFYVLQKYYFRFKFSLDKNDVSKWDIHLYTNQYCPEEYKKTSSNEPQENIQLDIMMTPIEHFDLEMK